MVSEALIRKIIQENLIRQVLIEEKEEKESETEKSSNSKKLKKKLLWVSKNAPDPLHHLQGSKKVKKTSQSDQKKSKSDIDDEEDCGCGCNDEECEDDDDWDFEDQSWEEVKNSKKKTVKEGRRVSLREETWTSKLGKALTGRSHELTTANKTIIDASDYELCGDKEYINIESLIDLIKELYDIFDENDLLGSQSKYFTITPFGVDQASKIYKNAGHDLYVICLGVGENSYNLWDKFKESNDLKILQKLVKKEISEKNWASLWNWLLSILSVGTTNKAGDIDLSRFEKNGGGVKCYSINNFVINFKNKVSKLQSAAEEVESEKNKILDDKDRKKKLGYDNPLVVGLIRMLKRGKDLENNKLTPEKIRIIKDKIKEELKKDESWGDWAGRKGSKIGNALIAGGIPIFGSGEMPDVDEKDYEDL